MDRRAGRKAPQHGECGTPLHRSWIALNKRCFNPKVDSYPFYGGRGITVHEPWRIYPKFAEEIRATIGDHPGKPYQLDRIDTDGHYEPGNVQWVTPKANARKRRSNRLLTWDGKTQCVSAWAEEMGWGRHVILNRIKLGWTTEEIFTTPKGSKVGGWERRRKNAH
jgi:hypothetical protein